MTEEIKNENTEAPEKEAKKESAKVKKENEWFTLPQRYPVQIRILDPDPELYLHFGASAYVELEIPSRPFRQFFWELFLWK